MSSRLALRSGGFFDFLNPEESIYTVADVALGLSRTFRFAGHTTAPITVAQHSVVLSNMVAKEFALAALLHDASEAFIGDIVRSAKQFLHDYQAMEKIIMRDVFARVGLIWDEFPESIKKMDAELGDLESRLANGIGTDFPEGWEKVQNGWFWDSDQATAKFGSRWITLSGRMPNTILLKA